MKALKKTKPSSTDRHERKKEKALLKSKREHLKVLIKYIDKDYADVKTRYIRVLPPVQFVYQTHTFRQSLSYAREWSHHVRAPLGFVEAKHSSLHHNIRLT